MNRSTKCVQTPKYSLLYLVSARSVTGRRAHRVPALDGQCPIGPNRKRLHGQGAAPGSVPSRYHSV